MQKKFGSMVAVIVWLALIASPVLAAREYWIAADEVQWDYAPAFPINPMTGKEFTAEQRVLVEQGIGRRYLKRPMHGCYP